MAEQINLETLANHIDRLAGTIAGLAAIVAHMPGVDPRDLKAISTVAQQLAPRNISRHGLTVGTPGLAAEEIVQKVMSISQSLAAVRSAGQWPG